MPVWTQVYFPWGESMWPLSTFVAAIPVMLVFYLLAGRGAKPHWSALAGAGAAMSLATLAFGLSWPMSRACFLFCGDFGVMLAWVFLCVGHLHRVPRETCH